MKTSNRKFSSGDKLLIGILALILLSLAYYYFFYTPVKDSLKLTKSEIESSDKELKAVNNKIADYKRMDNEISVSEVDGVYPMKRLEDTTDGQKLIYLQLYKALDNINFSATNVEIGPQPGGNMYRQNIRLSFSVPDEQTASDVISAITDNWDYRCLIGDLSFTKYSTGINVSATVTFYQTNINDANYQVR